MRGLVQQSTWILWGVIVLVCGTIFFLTPATASARDCCLVIEQKHSYLKSTVDNPGLFTGDTIKTSNLRPSPPVPASCTVRSPGATCPPDEPKVNENCEGGGDGNELCTFIKRTYQKVSCEATLKCHEKLKTLSNCSNLAQAACDRANGCFWDGLACQNKYDRSICTKLKSEALCTGTNGSKTCVWKKEIRACITKTEGRLSQNRLNQSDILPDCAVNGTCRSINDLVETAIRMARKLFGLFGSFAFLMFIYGGVRMIASFGNPEQFQKGKTVLSAAIIGIIISFGAFMLIGYVLQAVGLDSDLRAGVSVKEPAAPTETPAP